MNNIVNLYSQYNYSDEETRLNRKRTIIAIIAAIIIHIVLIFFLGSNFFDIPTPTEEIKVLNVQLLESKQKPTTLTPKQTTKNAEKEKTQTKKESVTKSEKMEIQQEKVNKQIQKVETTIAKQQSVEQTEIVEKSQISEEIVVETTTPIENEKQEIEPKVKKQSAFEKFAQAQDNTVAVNQQKWAENNAKQNTNENDAEFEQTKTDLDNIKAISDAHSEEIDKENSDIDNQTGTPEGDIKWNGSSRRLKSAGGIEAPEEISYLGIKTSITLQFEVYQNGLIGEVKIIESSGETEWDNFIVDQFKANYRFDTADKNATGIIQIKIGL